MPCNSDENIQLKVHDIQRNAGLSVEKVVATDRSLLSCCQDKWQQPLSYVWNCLLLRTNICPPYRKSCWVHCKSFRKYLLCFYKSVVFTLDALFKTHSLFFAFLLNRYTFRPIAQSCFNSSIILYFLVMKLHCHDAQNSPFSRSVYSTSYSQIYWYVRTW